MIKRKTVVGLTVLCALMVSAFAAQAAQAETTAHTCTKTGTGTEKKLPFSDAHCKVEDEKGEYKHVEIPKNTPTEITGTDITTGSTHSLARLKATIAGSAIELIAQEVEGSGTMENKTVSEKMLATGSGSITYKKVKENLLGCTVTGKGTAGSGLETVVTYPLTATTTEGMQLKFTPSGATPFAEFELTGCIVGPLLVKVFGSVNGNPEGATTNTTHNKVTEELTLRLQNATSGPKAGIEGTLTISGRANSSQSYTPLSVTTP